MGFFDVEKMKESYPQDEWITCLYSGMKCYKIVGKWDEVV